MKKNERVCIRTLTDEEKAGIEKEKFDCFAVYATVCPCCGCVDRSNMYLRRAQERINTLHASKTPCPDCGKCQWELGYPVGTMTGIK